MHHGPEFTVILILCFTLVVGAALRLLCPKLNLPYTIGVLLVGLGCGTMLSNLETHTPLALLKAGGDIGHELIIFVFLPALVFESAFSIDVHAFRKDIRPILLLAGPALLVCTGLTGLTMKFLTSFSWQWSMVTCLTFGALISATDPVAVVALLKELGAPKRLGLMIEGESLFNDGTSIVVFGVLVDILTRARPFESTHTLLHFLLVTLGGFFLGLLIAAGFTFWMGRIFNDSLVEITITLVIAYATMLVVEGMLHLSGVMAVVAAGLWLSGPGRTSISPEAEHFLHRFWETLSYLANTMIFFLVGLVMAAQGQRLGITELGLIVATYVVLMVIRSGVLALSRPFLGSKLHPVSGKEAKVMAWGGLRGAVSLALALLVTQEETLPLELREQLLLVTAGVVFLTILVNGTTLGKLLQRLGLDKPPAGTRLANLSARLAVLKKVTRELREAGGRRDLRTVTWGEVDQELAAGLEETEREIQALRLELSQADEDEKTRGFWRQCMRVERQAYWSAYGAGCLSARTAKMLDHEVDARLDRLEAGREDIQPGVAPLPQEALLKKLSWLGGPLEWLQFEALSLRHDLARGQSLAAEAVLKALHEEEFDEEIRRELVESYREMQRRGRETLEDLRSNLPEVTRSIETRLARRVLLNLERDAYDHMVHTGAMDPASGEEVINEVEQRMKKLSRTRQKMDLPETADLVRETVLFSDLTEHELEQLAVITKERFLNPGDRLFEQGSEGESLFVIARGAVLVFQDEKLVEVLGGGDMFEEISLLTGAPRSSSITAATTVTLGEIARSDFEELLDSSPGLREKTWGTLARRLFEDVLRSTPEYQHLEHGARLGWFEAGRKLELAAGERLEEQGLRFLAVGRVESESSSYTGPCFLPEGETFSALEHCWVAVLPPLQRPIPSAFEELKS